MKYKLIIMFLIAVCGSASAYTKLGFGLIVSQPSAISYNSGTIKQDINYSTFSAHAETGINLGDFSVGIHYAKGSGDKHDPSKLEAFVDYDWLQSDSWQLITGVGYKLMYQDYTEFNSQELVYNKSGNDKLSARIGLSRAFGKYELGLWHHSQWFAGVPFDNTWEYHKTEITFGVRF